MGGPEGASGRPEGPPKGGGRGSGAGRLWFQGGAGGTAKKVLRGAALTLLGAELAYVLLANAALSSGFLAKVVTQPELTVALNYDGMWTIVPGLVSFRHASFQSQDHNVEWRAEISNGRAFVRLWPLAQKKISIGHLRGENVVFRFRHRVEPEAARQPKIALFPPIPGLDDPAVFSHEPVPESDPTTFWNVSLDDVDATIGEIWAQEFRYQGPGRVYGSFQLAPAQRVWVGPAELELLGGALTVGEHRVARGLEGVIRADIPEFDVNVPQGMEVLRQISANIDLDAQIEGLSFLALYGLPAGVEARDGSGQFSTRLRVERGVALAGSGASYETKRLALRRGEASVVAAASADWRVGEGGSALSLDVSHASLAAGGGGGTIAWARGAEASISLPQPDFGSTDAWRPKAVRARLAEVGADDLSRLHQLTGKPEGWALRGGSARASGELRAVDGGEASVDFRAKAEKIDVLAADTRWTGGLSLTASTGPFEPQAKAGVPGAVRLEGRDIAFTPQGGSGRSGWWFALDMKNARLAFAPALDARAGWTLRARDLSPMMIQLAADGGVPGWFAKWLDLEGVNASGSIAFGPGRLDLDVGSASAGALDARGRYVIAPEGSRGAFRVAMGPLAAGLRLREGKVGFAWPLGPNWLTDEARSLGAPR